MPGNLFGHLKYVFQICLYSLQGLDHHGKLQYYHLFIDSQVMCPMGTTCTKGITPNKRANLAGPNK